MENAGFKLKDPTDHRTMAHYSSFMFDSDIICEKLGYSTPQEYFEDLMEHNPLVEMPDASVYPPAGGLNGIRGLKIQI